MSMFFTYYRTSFIYKLLILINSIALLMVSGCQKNWEEHYAPSSQSVNELMWDNIRGKDNYSIFVDYIEKNNLDTLFKNNQQYTLFIPNNSAFNKLPDSTDVNSFLLNHLISSNVFYLRNISSSKKLQTLSGKFALIEHSNDGFYFDEAKIVFQSPLYLNGRYYEVEQFPFAKLSFREYFSKYLPVIDNYVNSRLYDSLDKNHSTPVGFDEEGNTIYDSVFITVNPFEEEYFPISKESRNDFATFILFNQDQYNNALNEMAAKLGGTYSSYADIPLKWQESILLPILFENGLFEGTLSIEELSSPNLLNIWGNNVVLNASAINPDSKQTLSNGYIYEYYDFQIPDSLYLGQVKIEGESLIDSIGQDKYAWKELVNVQGEFVEPLKASSDQASDNAMVVVNLGRSFSGNYSVELVFPNIFPGRHRLEWRANYRPSGVYKIFVNGEELKEFDTYNLRSPLLSVTGELFRPSSSGFNSVDMWVDNLTQFGDVIVRFEFVSSGISATDGFNIDYVSLIPDPN